MTVELPYPFRPYQLEAIGRLLRFSVLVWHRRAGKTVFAVKRLVHAALKTEQSMARFGYVAPYYRQAREVAWGYLHAILAQVPSAVFNESELQVVLGNGARIRLYGADNPDSLRGVYWDGVVLDEVADMRSEVWGEIIRPALTDREGWALFIGTPKGVNLFSELYQRGTSDPDWYADVRRASETGAIPVEELQRARREMTASQYAQEMECDFSAASDDTLIPLASALEAMRRDAPCAIVAQYPRVLGVDVARYGDDRSVIARRQGPVAFTLNAFRGLDTMEVAGQVAKVAAEWSPRAIFVDEGGIGAGVLDRVRQLGYPALGVNFGAKATREGYENKRVEMWSLLAEWLKTGCIPEDQELVREMTAPTYTYANARGRQQLESKDDLRERLKCSPDKADALALTFAAPVPMEDPLGAARHRRQARHEATWREKEAR